MEIVRTYVQINIMLTQTISVNNALHLVFYVNFLQLFVKLVRVNFYCYKFNQDMDNVFKNVLKGMNNLNKTVRLLHVLIVLFV